MARNLVSITTLWKPRKGGINAFNNELCHEFKKVYPDETWKVFCIVGKADADDFDNAGSIGITLISVEQDEEKFEILEINSIIPSKLTELLDVFRGRETAFIGHDIFSSDFALALNEQYKKQGYKSICCVFHHMNYEAYDQNKTGKSFQQASSDLKTKITIQNRVLKKADLVFGVGPKLQSSARDKRRKKDVKEFVPGLPHIQLDDIEETRLESINVFKGITWGRVEQRNDKIKQFGLSVASFGAALAAGGNELFEYDSKLSVVGVADEKTNEWITATCEKYSDGRNYVNVIGDSERDWLIQNILINAHLSLMLSTHEGFGLVGLESIAAEVPVIISTNSGLFQLLKKIYKETIDNFIVSAPIIGKVSSSINESDVAVVKEKILGVRKDYKNHLAKIKITKERYGRKYTWRQSLEVLCFEIENQLQSKTEQIQNNMPTQELDELINLSRDAYLKGEIQLSYEWSLQALNKFPSSGAAFLRLTKASIRLDKREIIELFISQNKFKKDDNFHYALMHYERTFNNNYKGVLNHFNKLRNKENLSYQYEAGMANFFIGVQQYNKRNSKKARQKRDSRIIQTLKFFGEGLRIATKFRKDHWWIDVMMLLLYKSYSHVIEVEDWKVEENQTLNDLKAYIQKYPLKASAKIYRILLCIIFERDDQLKQFFEEDVQLVSQNPEIFLPLDFIDSMSIRVLFLFENETEKLAHYNETIEKYISLYKNKSR